MFELMSRLPELSDRIITVFAARRRRFLVANDIGLTLIGAEADRDVRQIEALAHRSRLPVRSLAIGDPAATKQCAMCGVSADEAAVIVGKDRVVTDPTPRKIADHAHPIMSICSSEVHPLPCPCPNGIYVIGDVRSGSVKRVASAVGEGSVLISCVWQYVDSSRQS